MELTLMSETKPNPLRIVYCGCGLAGKTTNLKSVYESLKETTEVAIETPDTGAGRVLRITFDLCRISKELPVDANERQLQLSCAPGGLATAPRQRTLLEEVDGIVFVVDSQRERTESNINMMKILLADLAALDLTVNTLPFVIQYNKRDLPNALDVEDLRSMLNPMHPEIPDFETIAAAPEAPGVLQTLRAIVEKALSNQVNLSEGAP